MSKVATMVVFVLPATFRHWVGGDTEVKVFAVGAPPTLGSALDTLRRTHPDLEGRLRDDDGRIRRHISMVVCGEYARGIGDLDCALPPGAEVFVLPALA
ncbi:hypothetical protein [Nonomuraea sp. NPDC050310]|uniref:hypothetical protein n=1 Tax=unclassified Nonomuraea TaxID=2593643 RepID=UPI0033C8DAE9